MYNINVALNSEPDIVKNIKLDRYRWAKNVTRMPAHEIPRKLLDEEVEWKNKLI